jgi:hypothetical protein
MSLRSHVTASGGRDKWRVPVAKKKPGAINLMTDVIGLW